MGIDPGYGSSAFGIVVTQWEDNHIQVLYAEEHHRPDYNEMLSTVYGLISKFQVDKIYIDRIYKNTGVYFPMYLQQFNQKNIL
jgi:Holliday junction resolvasome RuvABC endonuclease subunit